MVNDCRVHCPNKNARNRLLRELETMADEWAERSEWKDDDDLREAVQRCAGELRLIIRNPAFA